MCVRDEGDTCREVTVGQRVTEGRNDVEKEASVGQEVKKEVDKWVHINKLLFIYVLLFLL